MKKPTTILLLIVIKLTSNFDIQIRCLKALHYYRLDIIKNTKTYAYYKLYIVRYTIYFLYFFSLNFIIVVFRKSDICILSTCFIPSLQASFPFFVNWYFQSKPYLSQQVQRFHLTTSINSVLYVHLLAE